jgi:hypothetical protein
VLQDEVLQRALLAVLDEEEERVLGLLGVDVLEDVGVDDLPQ